MTTTGRDLWTLQGKAEKVIASCYTVAQTITAENYIRLLYKELCARGKVMEACDIWWRLTKQLTAQRSYLYSLEDR